MNIIKLAILVFNIIVWLIADVYLFSLSWCCGWGGLIGIVSFVIGYSISEGMTVAQRDKWRLPNYEVFKKKLRYGNLIAGSITAISSLVLIIIKILIES